MSGSLRSRAEQRLRSASSLVGLRALWAEQGRRSRAADRAARVARGLADTRWFLAYYFPHLYPDAFGRHHHEIIADFDEMVAQAEAVRRAAAEEKAHEEDADVDAADEQLTAEEAEELLRQDAEGRVPFAAAYACPRDHGKSTLVTGLVCKAVVYRLRRFVLFVGDIVEQGDERLNETKEELETNERLREDFGDLVEGARRWQDRDAITGNGVRLRAYGTGSKIRGVKFGAQRPDMAVVDDGENDEAVLTEPRRRKTRAWLTKVLMNALDSNCGLLFVIGTVLHHDSLLARLTSTEHFLGWRKRVYRALERTGQLLSALWSARWPVVKLLRRKEEIGPIAFATEFQNDPTSDEVTPFKMDDLNVCRERGRGRRFAESYEEVVHWLGFEPLILVDSWDFGWVDTRERAEETDSNYTAGIAVAVHPKTRHRYILRIAHDRGIDPVQVKHLVVSEGNLLRPPPEAKVWERFRIVVESVGLQKQLYDVGLRNETDLPLAHVSTDRRKHDPFEGVPRIATLVIGHQYVFPWPEGTDDEAVRQRGVVQALINELWGLGREAHDDLVMALWFAEVLIGKMLAVVDRKLKEAGTPWATPAEDPAVQQAPADPAPVVQPETAQEAERRKQHERSIRQGRRYSGGTIRKAFR